MFNSLKLPLKVLKVSASTSTRIIFNFVLKSETEINVFYFPFDRHGGLLIKPEGDLAKIGREMKKKKEVRNGRKRKHIN